MPGQTARTCLEEIKMKYYVTLTGLNYRFGTQPFTVGQKVKLVKEPENDFDSEEDAIAF